MIDWQQISLEDLAGYISEKLRQKGIDVILVGGGCVTIYSNNRYQSYTQTTSKVGFWQRESFRNSSILNDLILEI